MKSRRFFHEFTSVGFRHILLAFAGLLFMWGCQSSRSVSGMLDRADQHCQNQEYAQAIQIWQNWLEKHAAASDTLVLAVQKKALHAAQKWNNPGKVSKFAEATLLLNWDAQVMGIWERALDSIGQLDRWKTLADRYQNEYWADLGQAAWAQRMLHWAVLTNHAPTIEANYLKLNPAGQLKFFEVYWNVVKNKLDKQELYNLARSVLKQDPHQLTALRYQGVYLYDRSEAEYRRLMADYEKNKNATTYAYLRRDLKVLSADFRQCRAIFETLRTRLPDDKQLVSYLYNIYLRLDLTEEANKLSPLLPK